MHHGRQKYGGGSTALRILVVGSLAGFLLWLAAVFFADIPSVVPQAVPPESEAAATDTQMPQRRTVSAYFLPKGYRGEVVMRQWYAAGFPTSEFLQPDWVAWELTKERVAQDTSPATAEQSPAVPDSLRSGASYAAQTLWHPSARWRWHTLTDTLSMWALEHRHLYIVVGRLPADGGDAPALYLAVADMTEPVLWRRAFVFPEDGGEGEMEVYEVGVEVVEERCGIELFGF